VSRQLFVPPILLDRASAVPLHRQIYRQIGEAIRGGAIQNQARLPSTRVMAKLLRVSRNTVLAAYEDLAADDLLRAERGTGMRVHHTPLPEPTLFGLRQVIRDAGYPARILALEDIDGNPLYIRH
jgi:DNA-binding GntR family transcriptional regulator